MQLDNFELTTVDYALKYYLEHNENLDDEDIEWCNLVRKKVDSIIARQSQYDMGAW
mgnify:FL=1